MATNQQSSMVSDVAGIDFGTSNSSIGHVANGEARLIDIGDEGQSVPSAIFYSHETPDTAFGRAAIAEYTKGVDGRLLRSLKSVLGTSLMNEKTVIRNRRVSFSSIIEDYFRFLKAHLDSQTPKAVNHVVLGRPVHFVDDDLARDTAAQTQLQAIAKEAGFDHVEFQLEPVAAALNYEVTLKHEELVMIVDIGGGTADFSVIRLSPERHSLADRTADVLGNMGVHIGGTDFDRLLSLQSVMPALGYKTGVRNSERLLPGSVYFDLATWHRIPLLYTASTARLVEQMHIDAEQKLKVSSLQRLIEQRLGHELARCVELAKIELSGSDSADLMLKDHDIPLIECVVTRDDIDRAIDPAMEQLSQCVREGLQQAGVQATDIASVFYTGGSSSVPCLQLMFEALLPDSRHTRGDVFGSVGLGLTIDASRRFA